MLKCEKISKKLSAGIPVTAVHTWSRHYTGAHNSHVPSDYGSEITFADGEVVEESDSQGRFAIPWLIAEGLIPFDGKCSWFSGEVPNNRYDVHGSCEGRPERPGGFVLQGLDGQFNLVSRDGYAVTRDDNGVVIGYYSTRQYFRESDGEVEMHSSAGWQPVEDAFLVRGVRKSVAKGVDPEVADESTLSYMRELCIPEVDPETISRSPVSEDPETERIRYGARIAMLPDQFDLIRAAQGGHYILEAQRAQRAGIQTRLQAIKAYNLADWRKALECLLAVCYGWMNNTSYDHEQLVRLFQAQPDHSHAEAVLTGFGVARHQPESWLDAAIVEAIGACVSGEGTEDAVRQAAIMTGLYAQITKWELWSGFRRGEEHWYRRDGQQFDVEAALASGQAFFGPGAAGELLRYWAALANQKGEETQFPEKVTLDAAIAYCDAEIAESRAVEGNDRPAAGIERTGNTLELWWNGQYTAGRSVSVFVWFDEDGETVGCSINWDSGTGRPSTFLSVERLFGLEEFNLLEPLEEEVSE